jgi:acetyltransferase
VSLEPFFNPRSVAVIGASKNPQKLGHAVLANLIQADFLTGKRRLYPINPGAKTILDLKAYPKVTDVPGTIDLAIIAIPYPYVPEVMRTCGEKKIPAAIVISAGFREAGMQGLQRERELTEIVEQYGIRLIGPNCLGVIDTTTPLNASFSAGMPTGGPMAFMSQSGALGTAILDWALAGKLGLSKFVSLGNKADVNETDLLHAWENDPNVRVILIYTEGLPDGQAFIRTARQASKKKPIVALKSGVTQAGSRAVSSHTGSLAGSEQAYQAAFQQAHVLRAGSLQDLFDQALIFAHSPAIRGDRVAIVTNAGGPGILATDAIERAGLHLARFDPQRIAALEQILPDAASAANPVDVLGDALADRYRFALEQVTQDPNVNALLVILTPQAVTQIPETAAVVCEIAAKVSIPVVTCFMGEARIRAGVSVLEQHNVPNFAHPERAALALSAMHTYRRYLLEPPPEYQSFAVDQAAVKAVIEQARSEGRVTIGDAEARAILKAYGIPAPPSELAETPEKAIAIADRIGYPVVLKVASPDILHKTDVGGVKVGLQNSSDVRDAFDLITYRAQRYLPEARLWGCLVQKMVEPGIEILIGMNRDPQFGPLITFGLGGIYVEILKDVSFRVAPLSRQDAGAMQDEIRAHALLDGVRGQEPVDQSAIAETLLRVSQLAMDHSQIAELDINPFVAYQEGRGGIALDMRLVLAASEQSEA